MYSDSIPLVQSGSQSEKFVQLCADHLMMINTYIIPWLVALQYHCLSEPTIISILSSKTLIPHVCVYLIAKQNVSAQFNDYDNKVSYVTTSP